MHRLNRVSSLPPGSLEQRVRDWQSQMRQSKGKIELSSLYCGDAWRQCEQLAADIRVKTQGQLTLLVASAGLGLRNWNSRAGAYGATFTRGHADSVASDLTGSKNWWALLQQQSDTVQVSGLVAETMFCVLSATYAQVLDDELRALATSSKVGRLVVFGGSEDIPGALRIPSDRQLLSALGGTAVSLNVRMARKWLTFQPELPSVDVSGHARWSDWVASSRKPPIEPRRPMTDQQVLRWLSHLRQEMPRISATRALRHLRNQGHACEQKRFAMLFSQGESNV